MIHEPAVLFGSAPGAAADKLEERIRNAGIRVDRVEAGPKVLEMALFSRYDAVVLDASLQILEADRARDLIKANPRTQTVPVVLIDLHGHAADREGTFIQNPLGDMRWLEPVLQSGTGGDGEGMIQADLREMPLVDMLQLLISNQRQGVVEIESSGRYGRVEIAGETFGQIRQDDSAVGLKALARLLAWGEGVVRFSPRDRVEELMEGSAVAIMLDAVRLKDETDALRETIPAGSRLVYQTAGGAQLPNEPLLEEILLLVDFYGAVDDILERLEHPDAEILRAIERLHEGGWIDVRPPARRGEGGGGDLPDLKLPPGTAGEPTVVWLIGADADFTRVLWADARLRQRILTRRSLRNVGRFGGNGWFLNAGEDTFLWLRWLPVSSGLLPFIDRPGGRAVGAVLVVSDRDAEDTEVLRELSEGLVERGLPTVWLPVDQHTGGGEPAVWVEVFGEDVPGRMLPPAEDLVLGFWDALVAIMEASDSAAG